MRTSSPPPITSSRWGARTKRIVVIVTLLFLAFVLWNLRGMLPLIIIASLLSYLLWPLVNLIERRLLFVLPFRARALAVIMTFVLLLAGIVSVSILIAPVIIQQIGEVGEGLPEVVESAQLEFENILSEPVTINGRPVLLNGEPVILLEYINDITGGTGDNNSVEDFDVFQVLRTFFGSIGALTAPAFEVLGTAVNFVINTVFMFVIMFYLMRDGDKFTARFVYLVPSSYQGDARRLLYELGQVWNAYFRGQLILSLTVGMAVYIAALILGLPNAPLLGLLAGLLEFIPNIGPFIAAVPAVLTALISQSSTFPILEGLPFALVVIAVWTGIQNLEAIFLVPRVMGGNLDLHPVVVILAVIAGASIAGALGVILAAPFTASARVAGQYIYGKLFDTDPFPNQKHKLDASRSGLAGRMYVRVIRLYPVRVLWQNTFAVRNIKQISEEQQP